MSDSPSSEEGDRDGVGVGPEQERRERERVLRLLDGTLQKLPPLSSRIVRIFTSSTFTDTTVERNALMENVYPKLKEYCRERHGLEFQVVDMRWGVRDEATDDHMTTALCMQEIDNCQRLSMGPNFVVFLGQKYGYRPLPTHIVASDFHLLRECVKGEELELELLEAWYKRDDNYVPPVYALQPISSIYTNFNNKRHQRLQEADQSQWWHTFGKLQKILRKSAQVLFITKKIDREQMHNYFMSVTEREVERGILKAANVQHHCLAYIRDITNINTTLLRYTSKFIDIAARSVDGEAQKLLKTLRDEKLAKKLPSSNTVRFTVEWSGKAGIELETHREYLEEFCNHFYSSVTRLVDEAMARHEKLSGDAIYTETLQHMHACQQFCRMFQGREEVVEKIQQYIVGKSNQPLVLYGESGCGKTSLMAKGASQAISWFSQNKTPVMMLRFLGTTPCSSSIVPLITSLCKQMSVVYDQPHDNIPEDLAPLVQHFKKLISVATVQKPLVIFLDSLDQLSAAGGAHQLAWLPTNLGPYVKMVVSALPNYYGILDTLKTIVEEMDNFVQVLPLGQNLSGTILKYWLQNANRSISEEQWVVVNEAISKCNLPLYVKLVFDEICRWKSYTKPQATALAYTIHDSITKLFEKIELQHGKTLVSHALGYITASKSGLSEAELEDLLSLDEKVLNDVYQYHLPPTRRIPPLLWTRIRNDLPGYLSEREADGVNVIGWYHRQFIDAATERYFRNLNFVSEIHSNLAEYFLGTWGGGVPKPFEYSELQRQRFHLEEKRGECDRKVPLQPLVFLNAEGKVIRHNLRRLNELPYHLVRSHRYEDLFDRVLFNYECLHAKLSSMPLQLLLADFEDFLDHVYDKEVKLIADAIRLSSSVLNHFPDMLGPQIIGRLLPYYHSHEKIRQLIQQCENEGLSRCVLIPAHHCLHTPGGPLQYSLEGHPFAPFGIAVTSDGRYVVTVSNKFIIWDMNTGEVLRTVLPKIEGIMQNLALSPNDKYAVGFTNNKQIVICLVMTGDHFIVTETKGKDSGQLLGIAVSNTHLVAWKDKEWCVYTIDGDFVTSMESQLKMSIIAVEFTSSGKNLVLLKSGDLDDQAMALEISDNSIEPFELHSSATFSKDKQRMYTCIELSDNAVVVYKLEGSRWRYDRTLGENDDEVFALTQSEDETYLLATIAFGYKLWDLRTNNVKYLKLPHGVRNIPSKNQINSLVSFTRHNHFVVAGVRKNLYVWDVKQGNMVKVLDAHFGRIIALTAVRGAYNKVISSSIDKTIKVWNFDNILEDVHSIDRLEKPIDSIHLAESVYLGITTTRNSVGVWNLEKGKLLKNLPSGSHNSIVNAAVITKGGEYVIVAESTGVLIWDLEKDSVQKTIPQKDSQQVCLNEQDAKMIAFSMPGPLKGRGVCYTCPTGDEVYKFEYSLKKFLPPALTRDGLYLAVPAVDKSGDILAVFHAKNGTHLYNMQLKYTNYKQLTHLVSMPHEGHQIAVMDPDKGNIIDLKKKNFIRSVNRWNGMATRNGKQGLYAPSRGGLELMELKSGKTIRTFIPKVAEGVFNINVMFTKDDQHLIYYHSGHRTIRVFRVSDGKMIANFKTHAEVRSMAGSSSGCSVCLGTVDGSLTVLVVADPLNERNVNFLRSLPTRKTQSPSSSPRMAANGEVMAAKQQLDTALQVTRFVAKAGGTHSQQSRACVVS